MFASLQEVELYRLPGLELLKDEVIDLAVGKLPPHITGDRSDKTVAAVSRVVEPLVEVASLADIE